MFNKKFLDKLEECKQEWEKEYQKRYDGKEFKLSTFSGIPLKTVYSPEDVKDKDASEACMPGTYPFTRGIYPLMYQAQPWNAHQAVGTGTPESTRERYELLCKEGIWGYQGKMANFMSGCDQPNRLGYDSDHPLSKGMIGATSMAMNTLDDFEILYQNVDFTKTNIVMGFYDTSMIGLANLIVLAEKRGVPQEKLMGMTINYWMRQMFEEHPAFPPKSSLIVNREYIHYVMNKIPRWYTANFPFYDIMECGGNIIQELAFMLSAMIALTEECMRVGMDPDKVVTKFGFHVAGHTDFFETVCKCRALRRMWAKIAKDRFGCKSGAAQRAILAMKTAGATYTAQQPLNNVIRGTLEGLAGVCGGVNSLWVTHYDDPLAAPSEQAAILGIRTQQILLFESGVASVTDPLAGSYYVEWLTDKIEEEATKLLKKIDEKGGWVKCTESGWFRREIDREAIAWRQKVDRGEYIWVGVNKFKMDEIGHVPITQQPDIDDIILGRLKKFKENRDFSKTKQALAELKKTAERVMQGEVGILMPPIIECVKAKATMGETMDVLKEVFGWGVIE